MTADINNFQVNLQGIIDLLSDNLYSGPQVFLRELLPNGVDATTARWRQDAPFRGEIRIEVSAPSDTNPGTICMEDNGIGLTEEEVHEFLATIGQSSKRDELDHDDFIGQFGIGLLSAFVVSDEIVVITCSAQPGARPVEWRGKSDGTYSVRILDGEFDPGTRVYLRAKEDRRSYFEPECVQDTARHYGRHLPVPIQFTAGELTSTINDVAPWQEAFSSVRERRVAFLAYGKQLFGEEFLDAIPLESSAGDVQGIAFVLPHSTSLTATQNHRVYLKNMLLSESVDNLMPDWAFFVRCVVNSNSLRPTAARESFYEDSQLERTQNELGECLRQFLVDTANEHPERLDRIIELHYLPMKALATVDDSFFELLVDFLPFETSMGRMRLGDYRKQESVVRYVNSRDQFRQIASVAAAQSICVINAGYVYDTELIEKLPHVFDDVDVELCDSSELTDSFEDLELEQREQLNEFLRTCDTVLQPFRCASDIRKFEPQQLPALYTSNDEAAFVRSVEQSKEIADELWNGVLDRITESPSRSAYSQLCLNYNNPLVRRLSEAKDKTVVGRSIQMLYVQSLLLGHYPLKSAEMVLLNEGLLGLIDASLGHIEAND